MSVIAGITVDFRAGIVCPAINRPVSDDDDVVFFSVERLVRMNSREFITLARRRRQAPQDLLREILKAAATAAQEVLDKETDEVRGKVLRLLLQGEIVAGRGMALVFQTLV